MSNSANNKMEELLWNCGKFISQGCLFGWKKVWREKAASILFFIAGVNFLIALTWKKKFLNAYGWGLREFYPRLSGILNKIPWIFYFWLFLIFSLVTALFYLGIRDLKIFRHYQRALDRLKLGNGEGLGPRIIDIQKSDRFKTKLTIRSVAIGIDRYETKRRDLEATFAEMVDTITTGANPQIIVLHLAKIKLAERCLFQNMEGMLKDPHVFLLGESMKGPLVQSIESLPHMLIAGTTGGGKSVFFKQALLGLLKTSPHLQVYLLDLKRGIEMKEFAALPNVRVAKTEKEAAFLLQKLKEEMDQRFEFLEKKGFKEIRPDRDGLDKIVLGIDEASVLYTKTRSNSEKGNSIHRARELTDELAKLARAAGMHLILATQKVTKETIDTKVQENIGGRLCFKMNTLQGSMTVLGNKMACDLPDIKGRGIWANGQDFIEVQAPFISEEELVEEIETLKSEFTDGKRKIFGKMIEVEGKNQSEEISIMCKAQDN